MNIVRATPEDAAGIALVHIRSWQRAYSDILSEEFLQGLSIEDRSKRWADILRKSESHTFVAHQDGSVIGFISFGRCRDEEAPDHQGEIWALYAQPEFWGQGVGRALLGTALQELRAVGYGTVSLWVLSKNHRGLQFYKASGFERVAGSEKLFELGGREVEEVSLQLRNDA